MYDAGSCRHYTLCVKVDEYILSLRLCFTEHFYFYPAQPMR